jgi:signal peptide peptidase SppA
VASDTIYNAVCFARAHKPVVASFSDVAASGGYYAAAGADLIYSNHYTITGSIGVIVAYPIIKRLLEKIDISADAIEFIPNAAWHHPELGDLPPAELEKLSRHVDATYETFKLVVSKGRRMPIDDVEKVAQGQVFTGSQAMGLGLVDMMGGLNDALVGAATLSIEKERRSDHGALRHLTKGENVFYDDILEVGGVALEPIKAKILEERLFIGEREPTDDEIRALLKRATIMFRPAVSVATIPHVNPANEAFGYAVSSAFAPEEERSPVPIDQPLPEPTDEGGDGSGGPEKSRVVLGALLGLARTNNIPIWQFPFFCYWYSAQAVGKVGNGVVGGVGSGILDRMFAGIFGGGIDVPAAIGRHIKSIDGERPPLFNEAKSTGMDIRLEMMPLQIYF